MAASRSSQRVDCIRRLLIAIVVFASLPSQLTGGGNVQAGEPGGNAASWGSLITPLPGTPPQPTGDGVVTPIGDAQFLRLLQIYPIFSLPAADGPRPEMSSTADPSSVPTDVAGECIRNFATTLQVPMGAFNIVCSESLRLEGAKLLGTKKLQGEEQQLWEIDLLALEQIGKDSMDSEECLATGWKSDIPAGSHIKLRKIVDLSDFSGTLVCQTKALAPIVDGTFN